MSKETGTFTYKNGGGYSWEQRWITHDPNDHFAGEFKSEAEAKAACDKWNSKGGNLVVVDWTKAREDAPPSDRGTYRIRVDGTNWEIGAAGGWHAMEHATDKAMEMRNFIAKIWDMAASALSCVDKTI